MNQNINNQNINPTNSQQPVNPNSNVYTQYPGQVNELKPQNKKGKFMIMIIIIVLIALVGYFVYPYIKNTSDDLNIIDTPVKEEFINNDLLNGFNTFSKSSAKNNIAIPFYVNDTGFYALKINEEGIGEPFKYLYKNDAFEMESFYKSDNLSYSLIIFKGIWNIYQGRFMTGYNKLPQGNKIFTYEILERDNNNYLIKEKSEHSENYNIYLGNKENDYFVVADKISKYEDAKNLYDILKKKTELCYISLDETGQVKSATRSMNDSTSVDISNWRFINDMVLEYYINHGIKYNSSIFTDFEKNELKLNVKSNDNKINGTTISIISSNEFSYLNKKTSEDSKSVNLAPFESAYYYQGNENSFIAFKINQDYYVIKIDRKISSDEFISIINQILVQ